MSYTDTFTKALGKIDQKEPEIEALVAPESTESFTPPDVGMLDKLKSGQIATKLTEDEDLKAIASKHGISVDKARNMATLLGGAREWAEEEDTADMIGDSLLSLAGVANTAGLQVPGWIAKKLSDEKTQLAYDDIRKLVDSNKGLGQTLAEGLLPGAGVAKGAKLASKVGANSAIGAASGLAGSDTGSELMGAGTGAALSGLLSGTLDSRTLSKITSTPIFKKIQKKFNKPETVVDTGDEFKSLVAKAGGDVVSRAEAFDTTGGAVINKALSRQQIIDTHEYALYQRTLARRLGDQDTFTETASYTSGLRKLSKLEDVDKLPENTQKMIKEYSRLKESVGKFADELTPEDEMANIVEIAAKKSPEFNNLLRIKAKQISEKVGADVPGSYINPYRSGARGFNAGDKYTSAFGEVIGEESRAVGLHEYMHRTFHDVATAVSEGTDLDRFEVTDKLIAYSNDAFDKNVKKTLTSYIKLIGYENLDIDGELIPWSLGILNSKQTRDRFKDAMVLQGMADTEVDKVISGMKSGVKVIRKWAENADVEDLRNVVKSYDKGIVKPTFLAAQKETADAGLRSADNFFSNLTPDAVTKLEGMKAMDLVKEIPGLEINKSRKNGLEVFNVVVDGVDKGSDMSEEGARTRVLKWLKEMKNKSEVDFKRY